MYEVSHRPWPGVQAMSPEQAALSGGGLISGGLVSDGLVSGRVISGVRGLSGGRLSGGRLSRLRSRAGGASAVGPSQDVTPGRGPLRPPQAAINRNTAATPGLANNL